MRADSNLIPVESDVNQFLSKERFMLDTQIADVFKEFKIGTHLKACQIQKRTGHAVDRIVYDLVNIPFLFMTTVFLFVRSQYEKAASQKNKYYRLLENANYNWRSFVMRFSRLIHKRMRSSFTAASFFVLDDTLTEVTGKGVEGASYVYDHRSGKSILGFQKLVLGIFNGSHFLPISQKIFSSRHKPDARSHAQKYRKIPKSQRISPQSPGAYERSELDQTKLQGAISLLKVARQRGFTASTVLFDSWFCFNSFIKAITGDVKLHLICQLKNMPKPNKYLYHGRTCSLNELFFYYARTRLRWVKKHQFKQSVLVVAIPKSPVKLKIVFIQNEGPDKWYAFAASNITLSAERILESYSQRWSIEVFFKNCKQYLNYGKEQMSNLDSISACDALVFTRYLILTYLAWRDNASFYDKFSALCHAHSTNTFGVRLLRYFMNHFQFIITEVYHLLKEGYQESAFKLLETVALYLQNPKPLTIDLK
jgi:hypothetical protein